jgi:hypothetical protein
MKPQAPPALTANRRAQVGARLELLGVIAMASIEARVARGDATPDERALVAEWAVARGLLAVEEIAHATDMAEGGRELAELGITITIRMRDHEKVLTFNSEGELT